MITQDKRDEYSDHIDGLIKEDWAYNDKINAEKTPELLFFLSIPREKTIVWMLDYFKNKDKKDENYR